jgi:plasmid maintenance system antidote protein VapI
LQEPFDNATQNWMNFQKTFGTEDTFKTTAMQDIPSLDQRTEKF